MDRPPRDLKRDRLINGPLLRYSYLIAGIVVVRVCVCARARALACARRHDSLHLTAVPVQACMLHVRCRVAQCCTHVSVAVHHACCDCVPAATPQASLCMIAFFSIFWWHGVPLSAVYNTGNQYWQYPDSGRSLSFCT
jgi:hypothetical protein